MTSKETIDELRKTVVFLGRYDNGQIKFLASGCIVGIKKVFHLVTAKHVVYSQKFGSFLDENVFAFSNSKSGKLVQHSIKDLKKELNVNWIFHENKEIDVAIIPFPFNPEDEIIKAIPEDLFLPDSYEIHEALDVFFLSFQPGIEDTRKINPIVRTGIISLMNDDKTFYIDGATFPGNSGGPVFTKPGNFISGPGNLLDTMARNNFIGIVGEYVPYTEKAISEQTWDVRVIFRENTGLSLIWHVSLINEITNSEEFIKQVDHVMELFKEINPDAVK